MTCRTNRLVVSGVDLFAKSAHGGSRRHLRREAEILDHLRGTAVVDLVALRESDDRTDLVSRTAGDHDLSRTAGMAPSEVFSVLTATASAVADLHASGWVHGALCAEHVIVGPDLSVRLCSLGSASVRMGNGNDVDDDLQQLLTLTENVLAHPHSHWSTATRLEFRRLARVVNRALAGARRKSGSVPASDLARLLNDVVGSVGEREQEHPTRTECHFASGLSRPPLRLLAAAVGVGAIGLTWGAVAAAGQHDGGSEVTAMGSGATSDCRSTPIGPDIDSDGCDDAVDITGNIVQVAEARFRAGKPGDVVEVAQVDCERSAQVVLLRPSTGEMFTFDQWPGSQPPAAARLLGVFPDAVDIGLGDDQAGCARAIAIDPHGSPAQERPR